MLAWLTEHRWQLLFGILFAGYFAFYVIAIRHQHQPGNNGKLKLPCDRC